MQRERFARAGGQRLPDRLQRRHAPGGGAPVLPAGRYRAGADEDRHGQLQLSARAYHRVLKLARTIADLAGQRGDRAQPPGRGAAVPAED